jgi:hypothetical protein
MASVAILLGGEFNAILRERRARSAGYPTHTRTPGDAPVA